MEFIVVYVVMVIEKEFEKKYEKGGKKSKWKKWKWGGLIGVVVVIGGVFFVVIGGIVFWFKFYVKIL